MRRLTVAALAVFALVLAGCGADYAEGPAGTVVDKESKYKAAVKHWEYELTTQGKDGREHEFRVSRSDYDDCVRGARYPKCAEG
ncbi:hypothetical protein DEJ49_33190 [Streptomyces venezuelae]|uniref:Lipoprotein n=1 Tax=Streptomyces venezuelae TaxID=54571 RepID=A0A5P2CU85_STRVZ|nr:hypothetical protein DEJ49_33190 [Streptomyces venezuelae]